MVSMLWLVGMGGEGVNKELVETCLLDEIGDTTEKELAENCVKEYMYCACMWTRGVLMLE